MKPRIIGKKILPKYFNAVRNGTKNFELRKDEDNIQVGEYLLLREWMDGHYTGQEILVEVIYVLRDCPEYGLMKGYCILGLGGWNWLQYNKEGQT